LDKEAYLFLLDEKPIEINAAQIKEKMFETNIKPSLNISINPNSSIDLHIENLSKTFWRLSNAEILALQLKSFAEFMDQAISSGLDEVIIIHGVGEGTLKNAIHQQLLVHQNVGSFIKASEQKYGDGATLVRIK
jgi:Smr domain